MKSYWRILCAVGFLSLFCVRSSAADLYYYYDIYFGNNPTAPGPYAPWVTVHITDLSPGTVRLTISNSAAMPTGQKLDEISFNLNPDFTDLSGLTYTHVASGGAFALPDISTGIDFHKADGDGYYDIWVMFASGVDGGNTFTSGEYVTYDFTGLAGLDSSDFAFLSEPGPGSSAGPYFSAGHLLGLGPNNNKSAWIAPSSYSLIIPEPSPMAFMSLGGLLWVVRSMRRNKRVAS